MRRVVLAASGAAIAIIAACSSRVDEKASLPTQATASRNGNGPVYFEFQIDKPARQLRTALGELRYPDLLRRANVQGEVQAQFVVNEDGRVNPASIKILKSSHELFSSAVRTALPNMSFTAAETHGKKVRQLIQQPFTFSISQ